MKYLVTALSGNTPIPPEQAVELYQAADKWIQERLAEGRLDCIYAFADSGGISIGNGNSHEEVFGTLLTYPLYPYFRWEVKPLCDWGHTSGMIIEALLRGGG